jgi:hypothetical protein
MKEEAMTQQPPLPENSVSDGSHSPGAAPGAQPSPTPRPNEVDTFTDGDTSEYEVGYRRPPRHSRFQKGQSGNPRGRKKGSVNVETALRKAFFEIITVRDAGKSKKMTKLEVAYAQLANKAAAGDWRALKLMTQLLERFGKDGDLRPPFTVVISKEDSCVL